LGKTKYELGGSQYLLSLGKKGGIVPEVDCQLSLKIMEKLSAVIEKELIRSSHDCSEGGIGVALSEMLFSGGLGAKISLKNVPREKNMDSADVILFSESNSRFIVEVPPENKKAFEKIITGIPFALIGEVTDKNTLTIEGLKGAAILNTSIEKLKISWKRPIYEVMND